MDSSAVVFLLQKGPSGNELRELKIGEERQFLKTLVQEPLCERVQSH